MSDDAFVTSSNKINLPRAWLELDNIIKIDDIYQKARDNANDYIVIDFSDTIWSDPQPLLMLSSALPELSQLTEIQINLGTIGDEDHDIFLKFLATEGFLEAYAQCVNRICIIHDQNPLVSNNYSEIKKIISQIAHIQHSYGNHSMVCIKTKIINLEGCHSQDNIVDEVERLTDEVRGNIRDCQAIKSINARDKIFQKIRKIIYETMLNTYKHAYNSTRRPYSIYARIRYPRGVSTPQPNSVILYQENEWERIPTLNESFRSDSLNWFELYISDAGCGLIGNTDGVANKSNAKNDDLKLFVQRMLGNDVECLKVDGNKKRVTSLATGLQQINLMLAFDADYTRIFTNNEWIGGVNTYNQETCQTNIETKKVFPFKFRRNNAVQNLVPGTSYCFRLNIRTEDINFDKEVWVTPDSSFKKYILDMINCQSICEFHLNWDVVDALFDKSCGCPSIKEKEFSLSASQDGVLLVRPPRNFNKQHLEYWTTRFAGDVVEKSSLPFEKLIFCDLSPFLAIITYSLLQLQTFNKTNKKDIYLISRSWQVSVLTKGDGESSFSNNYILAKSFYHAIISSLGTCYFYKIRDLDSEIISKNLNKFQSISGAIAWNADSMDKKIITQYISIEDILGDVCKRYICYRSLQRMLYFVGDVNLLCCDDLIDSLYRELKSRRFSGRHGSNNVAISSVILSSETLKNFAAENDLKRLISLSIFIHKEYSITKTCQDIDFSCLHVISALNWPLKEECTSRTEFRRICNTPCIVRVDQEKSILFEDDDIRNKSDMYHSFEQLDCLRIGHFVNHTRHEILALNTVSAYLRSAATYTELIKWLYLQIKTLLFLAPNTLLIFPLHYATERIYRTLQEDQQFKDLIKSLALIHVSFQKESRSTVLKLTPSSQAKIFDAVNSIKNINSKFNAIVFDDDIVEGKYISEISFFLKSLGANNIYSICLLDRTGFPIYEHERKIYTSTHKRYWNFDIPTIGSKNHCILCEALNNVLQFSRMGYSSCFFERIQQWHFIWQAYDIFSCWNTSKISSFDISTLQNINIIQTHNGEEFKVWKSSSLTASLVEYARVTLDFEKALQVANNCLDNGMIDLSIEIVAIQFLLFVDRMTFKERVKHVCLLMQYGFASQVSSCHTPLIGLCASLCNAIMSKHIWMEISRDYISTIKIKSIDMAISVSILLSNIEPSFLDVLLEIPKSQIAKENYTVIGIPQQLSHDIVLFFRCVGLREGVRHSCDLHYLLRKKWRIVYEIDNDLKKLAGIFMSLALSLEGISKNFFGLSEKFIKKIDRDKKILLKCSNCISSVSKTRPIDMNKLSYKLFNYIYGLNDLKPGIAKSYRKDFFIFIRRNTKHRKFLTQEFSKYIADLKNKINSKAGCENEINIVNCLTRDSEFSEDVYVYADSLTRLFIRDIILNAQHSDKRLHRFDSPNFSARLWWKCKLAKDKSFFELKFYNSCSCKSISLGISPEMRHFEKMGGHYSTRVIYSRSYKTQIAVISLRLPLAVNLISGGDGA